MTEKVPIGISMPAETVNELDELKRQWDEREVDSVSRSQTALAAIDVGIAALEAIDDADARSVFDRTAHERRAIVRQGVLEVFSASDTDESGDIET